MNLYRPTRLNSAFSERSSIREETHDSRLENKLLILLLSDAYLHLDDRMQKRLKEREDEKKRLNEVRGVSKEGMSRAGESKGESEKRLVEVK